jgi:phage-related protein
MSGFSFAGMNSEVLSMFISKKPSRMFPERKRKVYNIPGRSGDLIVEQDAYENVIQEYDVYVKKDEIYDMQKYLTLIAQWLVGTKGYAWLTDDFDPTIKRQAMFEGGAEFLNAMNKVGHGTIRFSCKPQRFPINDEISEGTAPTTINYAPRSDLNPAYPRLTLTGTAATTSLTIKDSNGLRIVIPPRGQAISTILIDWETHTIINPYNNSVPSNTTTNRMWGVIGDSGYVQIDVDAGDNPTYKLESRRYYL